MKTGFLPRSVGKGIVWSTCRKRAKQGSVWGKGLFIQGRNTLVSRQRSLLCSQGFLLNQKPAKKGNRKESAYGLGFK